MSKLNYNRFIASLAITVLTATVGLTPATAVASEGNVKSTYNVQTTQSLVNNLARLGGVDKYNTATEIADYGWQSASVAVLAPSEDGNMIETLASSSLAKAIDGPILLTNQDSVPSNTMNELKKLGVTKVYLIGNPDTISMKVERVLTEEGIQSIRVGGNDHYETAVNIAKEIQQIKPYQEIVVTNLYATADAVSIAPIAAAKGIPILLVDKDSVPPVVFDFIKSLGITKTYVIGGTGVISETVKDALPNVIRLSGKDRFDTNTAVLKQFENFIVGGTIFFANGSDTSLIDSLAGAPMAAKMGGAIILSNKEAVPDTTKEFIRTDIALKNPGVLGGTAVMSDSAVQSLEYTQPDQSAIQNGSIELNTPNAIYKDETVNGNVLIDADNETLHNISVKGTVFVDPGKNGTTILDDVQADRIVILSGADHSIYLKGTQSNNLVVSGSSSVHVVAETGTTIGSTLVQSDAIVESQNGGNLGVLSARSRQAQQINVKLQGIFANDVNLSGGVKLTAATEAVIPKVNVSDSITPNSIQLEGKFPSVLIRDSSSINLLSGTIEQLEIKGTSSIIVENGAEVTNLVSDGGVIVVSGGGTVNGKTTSDIPTELDSIPSAPDTTYGGNGTFNNHNEDIIQAVQPVISGTIRADDTTISGTAEAGATISVKRNNVEIGSTTADGTTGFFTVTLNNEITLSANDTLSITATVPGKTESNATIVTVAKVQVQTEQPTVTGTVSQSDTSISGTAEAGATVSVMRNGVEIGSATADGTAGSYTVTLNNGIALSANDTLSITATVPGKTESNATIVTVAEVQVQTEQPTVKGTVGAGETMIMGTAEAGATVSVKRNEIEIGAAIADGTTGIYMLTLNDGITLIQGDVLLITATAPGKAESSAASVMVAAALPSTTPPNVGLVRAGDTMISGVTDAGAIVCIIRGEDIIGTATADGTGAFNITIKDGVILSEGDVLSIHAKAPDKAMSEITSVTVDAALTQPQTTPQVFIDANSTIDTTSTGTTDAGTTEGSDSSSTGDTASSGTN